MKSSGSQSWFWELKGHKVLCSHLVWSPGYIICVGEPLPYLNWLTQRAQHDHRSSLQSHKDGPWVSGFGIAVPDPSSGRRPDWKIWVQVCPMGGQGSGSDGQVPP
ncbi:uncharacterized protein ACWYII_030406 [Salvelinus alpinus]